MNYAVSLFGAIEAGVCGTADMSQNLIEEKTLKVSAGNLLFVVLVLMI
jgi:hypothetical protein